MNSPFEAIHKRAFSTTARVNLGFDHQLGVALPKQPRGDVANGIDRLTGLPAGSVNTIFDQKRLGLILV